MLFARIFFSGSYGAAGPAIGSVGRSPVEPAARAAQSCRAGWCVRLDVYHLRRIDSGFRWAGIMAQPKTLESRSDIFTNCIKNQNPAVGRSFPAAGLFIRERGRLRKRNSESIL